MASDQHPDAERELAPQRVPGRGQREDGGLNGMRLAPAWYGWKASAAEVLGCMSAELGGKRGAGGGKEAGAGTVEAGGVPVGGV